MSQKGNKLVFLQLIHLESSMTAPQKHNYSTKESQRLKGPQNLHSWSCKSAVRSYPRTNSALFSKD